MRSLSSISTAILLAVAMNPATAAFIPAGSILINGFGSNPMTLAPGPNNTLIISSSLGFTATGIYDNTDTGTAFFGPTSFTTQFPGGGILPGSPMPLETFLFTSSNKIDQVSMEIGWTELTTSEQIDTILGNSFHTQLLGAGLVITSSGEFTTDFPVNSDVTVNMFFPTNTCNANACATANVSEVLFTGESDLVAPPTKVPEPGSALIFLTALATFLIWRKRSEKLPDEP